MTILSNTDKNNNNNNNNNHHSSTPGLAQAVPRGGHTCHNLPPSEIDGGLFLALFAGSEGKYLFHRIG